MLGAGKSAMTKGTRPRRWARNRHHREGLPHALHVSGAESGGDAVHPQTAGEAPAITDLKAEKIACEYLVRACEQAIESLEADLGEEQEKSVRALITLRGIHADWTAALAQIRERDSQ
jgi:hypothetical protein